jgi:RHS repeat-associated protein
VGRRTTVTLPDNGTVTTEYFDTGETKKTYGTRTYPVEYIYDHAGHLKEMKTWRDYAGDNGTATTTWNYDAARGFLRNKVYDDSSSVTYSNSAAGRLLSRIWARGIITSYGYNNAGDVGTITYSDNTPSVTAVYDRRGRRIAVIGGPSVYSYTYDIAGQILTESFPTSNVIVTNVYDELLRRSSLSGVSAKVAYSYDSASRLSSVTNGTHTATYAYLPNSSLVSNIVFATNGTTKMTTTKSYDNLNRLTSIRSVDSISSVVSSHSYLHNDANQRTRVDLAGGSYWIYEYDSLGQLTSGKKYWSDGSPVAGQQFEYGFDTIGNRTNTVTNGRKADYASNDLNQYTQRTVPGYLDILGTAASNATVTVNNHATARKGNYFHTALQFSNASSAICTNIDVVGVRKNAGTNQQDVVTQISGHEFLPRSPEVFGYDADGNLTNDGRWVYTWDGENRLVEMQTLADLPSSVPCQKLSFAYDFQSRRVSKVVSNWNGSAWSEISNLRFVYDGWNLLVELDKTNVPVRSYTWGLDLSGSEQGAGGVGGLLAVTHYQPSLITHLVAHDGNGNVTALLNENDGSFAAEYKYSPFGEILRATGVAASLNPFRFSTKYTDETRFLYYGYRYYSPTTGRWLSRDPIEERGGLNPYEFVQDNPIAFSDSLGLAQMWFFTGINNWQEGTDYTSIETVIRENWKYTQESNFEGQSHELISDAGAALRYLWPFDEHPSVLAPWSKGILDREAKRMAGRSVDQGALCCSRIRVLMIAPKTNTRPPRNSCCNLETTVYWNPGDYVPNQGLLNPSGNEQYWKEWGTVHTVDTGRGHDFSAFINNARLPIVHWNRQYLREPGNLDSAGRWQHMYVPLGRNAPPPLDSYLRRWMNDQNVDHIFVCHSQGCNIAMEVLRRGCTKKQEGNR